MLETGGRRIKLLPTAIYLPISGLNTYSQGRLQAVRLYEATSDRGVKDILSWLIARDTMQLNQWIAAIKELEGNENTVILSTFPCSLEKREAAQVLFNFSAGNESAAGRWASGPSMDGKGEFKFVENPLPCAKKPV